MRLFSGGRRVHFAVLATCLVLTLGVLFLAVLFADGLQVYAPTPRGLLQHGISSTFIVAHVELVGEHGNMDTQCELFRYRTTVAPATFWQQIAQQSEARGWRHLRTSPDGCRIYTRTTPVGQRTEVRVHCGEDQRVVVAWSDLNAGKFGDSVLEAKFAELNAR